MPNWHKAVVVGGTADWASRLAAAGAVANGIAGFPCSPPG
jgi:hypothetical protein